MKKIKKSLCLLLSLVMLVSCCGAFAYAADSYDHLPQIYVEGLDSKPIYYKDDPEQNPLFYPIDGDMIVSNLLNYKDNIDAALKDSNPDLLRNYIYAWIDDCYGMIALEKDGYTMKEEVTVPETTLDYEGDGKYIFNYDTRIGPVDVAKELNEYIKWVQADSGSERFELVGASYGACVVLAYLYEYPDMVQYIDSLVLSVPAINGVDFMGELFSAKINADPDALVAFVENKLDIEEVSLLLSALNKTGTLDAILESFVEPVAKAAFLDAVMDIIHDIFGTWPSLWACVAQEHFYDALANIYGEDYDDPNHEYAVHIDRLTYYHENIQVKNEEILKAVADKGVKVNVICKYGSATIPLSIEGNIMSDIFVNLKGASFGATCSMHQQKLPEGYTQALYPEVDFISPDGSVDASTCLFPYNTWFVKGLTHSVKNDAYVELINAIVYEDLDVFTRADMPQYLEVPEYDGNALVPMSTPTEEEKETSWLEDFLTLLPRLIRMLIDKIKAFFAK